MAFPSRLRPDLLWIVPLLLIWILGWIDLEWLLGLCFAGGSFCLSSVILILNAFSWVCTSFLPTTKCRVLREVPGIPKPLIELIHSTLILVELFPDETEAGQV